MSADQSRKHAIGEVSFWDPASGKEIGHIDRHGERVDEPGDQPGRPGAGQLRRRQQRV